MSQTLNVHVRVNDAETGKPTPVRIRFTGANGEYLPPLGRAAVFPTGRNEDVGGSVYLGGKHFAYIEGGCEIPLPTAVPLSVEITKGPAYIPIRQSITLGEGQLSLRFEIRRWTDERWNGFLHADCRCHFIPPHSAKLEAMAEGIDIANLLIVQQDYPSQDGHMYRVTPNMTAFSGQTQAIDRVFVNTFNFHPTLGSLGLLNCHRPVYPLIFGHMDETDDWSLADWCDQCHRKKGLVVWCNAYRPESGLSGGEALINAVLGRVDAIEIDACDRTQPLLPTWYQLLNVGVRLPLVGGSGKDSNRIALGSMRTLTPATENRTYSEWVECVRRGATVITNGPFLDLRVNGRMPGEKLSGSQSPLRITATADSIVPFDGIELLANGEVFASTLARQADITTAAIEVEHSFDGGWIAARCCGVPKPALYAQAPVFAHTSPIFVERSEMSTSRSRDATSRFVREIAAVRQWVESHGHFTNPRRKEHLLSLCDAAASKLAGQS